LNARIQLVCCSVFQLHNGNGSSFPWTSLQSFPRTLRHHDSIVVMVGKLSKGAHFIALKSTTSASEVAQIFIKEILRLHGFPKNII